MQPYKAVIFDIDGTIIDTEKAILHSLQRTLRELEGWEKDRGRDRLCSWRSGKNRSCAAWRLRYRSLLGDLGWLFYGTVGCEQAF